MKRLMKGFTMIELLIVIAVLGVLAVAVLSAINPVEQINRGKDTGSRSDAEQILSGIERYYTTQNKYPWQPTILDNDRLALTAINTSWEVGGSAGDPDAVPPVPAVAGVNVLEQLSKGGTQELKQSFVDRISKANYNPLYIYFSGIDGDSVYICFKPNSGSFDTEALARCEDVAGAGLPDDLKKASTTTGVTNPAATICATAEPYSCLP